MNEGQKKVNTPISQEKIFKIMIGVTIAVAGIFFIKDLIGGSWQSGILIGICLAIFGGVLLIMRSMNVEMERRQFVVCMSLLVIIFVIGVNSGAYYSDDYILYLAAIGMSGLYLRPKYAKIQCVLCDILLILQVVIHPEKVESIGQFIMCLILFTLAAALIYLMISRGRVYIEIAKTRAEEAEALLESLNRIGQELQKNYENSAEGIEILKHSNERMNENAEELKQGSEEVLQGAQEVVETCEGVQEKVHATERQVEALTGGVKEVEDSLETNRQNIRQMSLQIESVQRATSQVNEVFAMLQKQMEEITDVTKQLTSISSSTTMLALNASIEAARAGQSGAGFAVVATKVQELAVDSNKSSGQVADVVGNMQIQIEETTIQLAESSQVIEESLGSIRNLQSSFDQLTEQFGTLYQNIEDQNSNVNEVDAIFEELRARILEMSQSSQDNQSVVDAMFQAMNEYKAGMERMVEDTKQVHELSSNMIELAKR